MGLPFAMSQAACRAGKKWLDIVYCVIEAAAVNSSGLSEVRCLQVTLGDFPLCGPVPEALCTGNKVIGPEES